MSYKNLIGGSKFRQIKISNKDYAIEDDTGIIYDYELLKNNHIKFDIGKLTGPWRKLYSKQYLSQPISFTRFRDSPNNVQRAKITIRKKLDEINEKNYKKFLKEQEKAYAPDGPGYLFLKKRFESNQASHKPKPTRAHSVSSSRSRSRSHSTRKNKTIG